MTLIALTRSVPSSIDKCELMHLTREPIDFARAVEQHCNYESALSALGCTVQRLPSLPDQPDSVFVEDTAVVLPELAIIARPGAESRRSEVTSVADALAPLGPINFIERPGTLDGGDVLPIGSTIYVGESSRTNTEGIRQLSDLAAEYGYGVRPVKVSGCLHLKSAATRVTEDVILLNPDWVDSSSFRGANRIEVHPGEPSAANALWIGENVIYSATYYKTCQRLEQNGINVHLVDIDELQKAEGAVTCCSILISSNAKRPAILTENLELLLQTTEDVLASIERMSPSDRAEVSPQWLAQMKASASADPWTHGFAVVHRASGTVIGSCGFKGPPDAKAVVEIAYGIHEPYRGRGYATEVALALIAFAFGSARVRTVRAHTLPVQSASTRVLTKCEFQRAGEVVDPEDGLVWRWELRHPVNASVPGGIE